MLLSDVENMSEGGVAPEGSRRGRKVYSLNVHSRPHLITSCPFCWVVIAIYPTLGNMTPLDYAMFRSHLKAVHGLSEKIVK